MKGFKLTILLIAEVVCLIGLVAICRNTVTLQSIVPASRYQRNPTEENRIAAEQAKRDEQRFLWSVRVGFGLALILNTWAIVKVGNGKKRNEESANQKVEAIRR